MVILVVGPLLEEKYGSKRILEIMLVTALVTGITNFIFPTYTIIRGEWNCICIHFVVINDKFERWRNTNDVYFGGIFIFGTTGISRHSCFG